jgi:hypothetical protein
MGGVRKQSVRDVGMGSMWSVKESEYQG